MSWHLEINQLKLASIAIFLLKFKQDEDDVP